jgi:hypothetical protein
MRRARSGDSGRGSGGCEGSVLAGCRVDTWRLRPAQYYTDRDSKVDGGPGRAPCSRGATRPPASRRWWAALLGLAIISTALGYVVYFRILTTAGLLMPVIAFVLGTLVLGERLAPRHFAGMALIGAGLAVIDGRLLAAASYRPRPNPPQRRESP